jgi:ribonuclease HIII
MNIELQAKKKIEDILLSITEMGFKYSKIEKKQYNFEVTVLKEKQKLKVLVYFGKKGIKTVLQGNTESELYREILELVSDNFILPFKKENEIFYSEYIGTDETGKGDYFGPLVICAMYVDPKSQVFLQNTGVKDSKELTDQNINKIAKQIKKELPNNFNIILITPEKYNQLYEKFQNVNKLLDWAHSKAIENLLETFDCKTVITDQFSKRELTISNNIKFSKINFIQTPKAERYIGVAAASIMARNAMNNWFNKKEKEGYNLLKGASSNVKERAKEIVQRYGQNKLITLAKLHFKTTNQIINGIKS